MPEPEVLKTTRSGATPRFGGDGPSLARATPGSVRVADWSAPLGERKTQRAPVEGHSTSQSANRSWFPGLQAPEINEAIPPPGGSQ